MKTVSLPIQVPEGKYCMLFYYPYNICEYYDNKGGHSTCGLGFYDLKDTNDGVLKSPKCNKLKKILIQ